MGNRMLMFSSFVFSGALIVGGTAWSQSSSGSGTTQRGEAGSGSMRGGSSSDPGSNLGDTGSGRTPASGNEVPRSSSSSSSSSGTYGSSSSSTNTSSSASGNWSGSGQWSRENVRDVQQALRQKGYNPGPVDGVMGPRTQGALRQFQSSQNISATGQLDSNTASALGVSMSTSSAPMGTSSTGTTARGSAAQGSVRGGSSDDAGSNLGDMGKGRTPASGNEVPRSSGSSSSSPGSSLGTGSTSSGSSTGTTSRGSQSNLKGGSSDDPESNLGEMGKGRTPASGNDAPPSSGSTNKSGSSSGSSTGR